MANAEPFISHLVELRNRMIRSVGAVLIIFICLVPFANELYEWFAKPLISNLPQGSSMISTEPHGPFFIPFKFAFATAFALAIPVVLYQVWAFVAPGLYKNEKRIVFPLVVSSTLLFYLGILFAYYVVFPIIFKFFIGMAPDGVTVMTDISAYMSFALKLFFAFGVAFEVPVATVLLARMGVVSTAAMARQRPYIILGAFVIGMLMTPPDIFSQIMLAIPVCLLFEVGLFFARKLERNDLNSD
ncbi:MAG: twin-arginine translocase subunit TatC [Gammaproteobacteria bacterium]|nr:twin-arginine translocase subunit TatC [Gammaproteobacteria bacterium]